MSTTAIFAEHVVGGLMTLAWLALLAVAILGIPAELPTSDNLAVELGLLLAFAYALGVVFDRVWDLILDCTGANSVIRRYGERKLTANDLLRREVFSRDPTVAAEFVNYNRTRMRVARASFFNFVLITIAAAVCIALRGAGVRSKEFFVIVGGGGFLSLLTLVSFIKLSSTYEGCLQVVGYKQPAPTDVE